MKLNMQKLMRMQADSRLRVSRAIHAWGTLCFNNEAEQRFSLPGVNAYRDPITIYAHIVITPVGAPVPEGFQDAE
jgi:hypothetical protein